MAAETEAPYLRTASTAHQWALADSRVKIKPSQTTLVDISHRLIIS